MNLLKGLFWYFYYTKRVIIPVTREGLSMLATIARLFSTGIPETVQLGNYVKFKGEVQEYEWAAAYELVNHSHHVTVDYLATFGFYPLHEVQIIRHADQEAEGYGPTLGWKQTFEWRPTC